MNVWELIKDARSQRTARVLMEEQTVKTHKVEPRGWRPLLKALRRTTAALTQHTQGQLEVSHDDGINSSRNG
ncbi:unnamed protein product [Boreogadus saida]